MRGCNGHTGQGPKDEGAMRQWGDERADELPCGDAAPVWTGVEAISDRSYEQEEFMKDSLRH
jgi:hypothetical protein